MPGLMRPRASASVTERRCRQSGELGCDLQERGRARVVPVADVEDAAHRALQRGDAGRDEVIHVDTIAGTRGSGLQRRLAPLQPLERQAVRTVYARHPKDDPAHAPCLAPRRGRVAPPQRAGGSGHSTVRSGSTRRPWRPPRHRRHRSCSCRERPSDGPRRARRGTSRAWGRPYRSPGAARDRRWPRRQLPPAVRREGARHRGPRRSSRCRPRATRRRFRATGRVQPPATPVASVRPAGDRRSRSPR